ncbi:predicted permease [Hahella chejuensis KCTC 2396]|uniref:Predicted permease n=1 Tax=Hahella chejuensis (strain KCTC 2396) TaxID=349521 RepID=Q2SCM4_HAHCH|nr:AI-2E family transporter [Hahella chejuensis]ABC31600.1 predicted permease [Hahella chejuensis KCTC 2396]
MLKVFRSWFDKYFSDEEAVILFILLVAGVLVMAFFGAMLAPVIGSIVIAYILQGLVIKLQRLGMGHIYAVLSVFALFVGVTLASVLLILPLMVRQVTSLFQELPSMMTNLQTLIKLLPEQYPQFFTEESVVGLSRQLTTEVTKITQWVFSFSLSSIPTLLAIMIYAVLVPIMVFFFLKDRGVILNSLSSLLPTERRLMTNIWAEANIQFANYIRGKVLEILIVGVATYVAFVLMGLNYSLLLAVLVGLSVVIPYIGAAIVTIPVALIALFQWGWGPDFIWLMVAYGVIQALDGNVLVPLLFSEVVNLHPVVIIVSVLVFGGLWGIWGVFFAIPLATLLKAIFSAWPTVKAAGG